METKILTMKGVVENNETFRIDAEYFREVYLDIVHKIECKKADFLGTITAWITQGPNPSFSESGIPCLTGRNINKGEVSYVNPDYLADDEYQKLIRFQIQKGDILITLKGKGSIGKVGYVTSDRKAIFSRDVGLIRSSKINSGYLYVFLLSRHGKKLIERGETGGTGQATLTTSYLKSILIPRFSIEERIGDLLLKIETIKQNSSEIYKQAQTLLLSELGLLEWKPKHQLTFVKNFSDTQKAGRIDAEYFQPKYDKMLYLMQKNAEYVKKICDIESFNRRGIQPKYFNDGKINVITSKHILEYTLDYGNFDKTIEQYWINNKKAQIRKNDILIYTTGANIGRTSVYLENERCLASNHVNILRLNQENQIYVSVVLNSIIGRLQTEKLKSGAAQAELYPSDISNFIIPFVRKDIQNVISQRVIESYHLRKQSKHLLESAKRAVEIAIEEDEDTAIEWLNKEVEGVDA